MELVILIYLLKKFLLVNEMLEKSYIMELCVYFVILEVLYWDDMEEES